MPLIPRACPPPPGGAPGAHGAGCGWLNTRLARMALPGCAGFDYAHTPRWPGDGLGALQTLCSGADLTVCSAAVVTGIGASEPQRAAIAARLGRPAWMASPRDNPRTETGAIL